MTKNGKTRSRSLSMDREGDRVRQARKGLWANVHAKRERGEPPAKPGDKAYPDPKQWKKLAGKK